MARKDNYDIERFHEYGLYLPKRTIYVGSVFVDMEGESGTDAAMAEKAIKNLEILETLSHEPITIIMNNLGGDEAHGLAIYDAIKSCKSHVTIKILGAASSMGSIILQAGDERIMSPSSHQMVHYGTWAVSDHSKTAQKIAEENKRMDKWVEQLYLSKIQKKMPHFTLARVQRMLDHNTYLTAEQSIEFGLADSILKGKK